MITVVGDGIVGLILAFTRTTQRDKAPVLIFAGVAEQGPGLTLSRQYDTVKVVAADAIDGARAQCAHAHLFAIAEACETPLAVAAAHPHAEPTVPGVNVQAAAGGAGQKTVQIEAAPAGQPATMPGQGR